MEYFKNHQRYPERLYEICTHCNNHKNQIAIENLDNLRFFFI